MAVHARTKQQAIQLHATQVEVLRPAGVGPCLKDAEHSVPNVNVPSRQPNAPERGSTQGTLDGRVVEVSGQGHVHEHAGSVESKLGGCVCGEQLVGLLKGREQAVSGSDGACHAANVTPNTHSLSTVQLVPSCDASRRQYLASNAEMHRRQPHTALMHCPRTHTSQNQNYTETRYAGTCLRARCRLGV